MVSPRGGPEEVNTQAQSEQPQERMPSIQIISRAMPDYNAEPHLYKIEQTPTTIHEMII